MYKDIINYELAEGISIEHLLEIAQRIATTWMHKQPGFVKWEIHTNADGSYTDIVYWESKENAKNSEKDMVNISEASDWFACYKEGSINSKNLSVIAEFK